MTDSHPRWLEELDQRVKLANAHLEVIDFQKQTWLPQHIPLCMDTFLPALENSGAILGKLKQIDPSVPTTEEWMDALEALHTCARIAARWVVVSFTGFRLLFWPNIERSDSE